MENSEINIENIDWKNLETRNGSATTSELNVPVVLKALFEDPGNIEGFNEFWPNLCSEGVAWSAAYAAVPFVVSIAKRLPPENRVDHLFFVANVECCKEHDSEEIEGYAESIIEAYSLLIETLQCNFNLSEMRYLLMILAALKGNIELSDTLLNLHWAGKCPSCGEYVDVEYPQPGT